MTLLSRLADFGCCVIAFLLDCILSLLHLDEEAWE